MQDLNGVAASVKILRGSEDADFQSPQRTQQPRGSDLAVISQIFLVRLSVLNPPHVVDAKQVRESGVLNS